MQKFALAAFTLLCCLFAAAQTSSDEQEYIRSLKENSRNPIMRITGKAPVNGGFRMEGYWVWGSSVIQGEDGYHAIFKGDRMGQRHGGKAPQGGKAIHPL